MLIFITSSFLSIFFLSWGSFSLVANLLFTINKHQPKKKKRRKRHRWSWLWTFLLHIVTRSSKTISDVKGTRERERKSPWVNCGTRVIIIVVINESIFCVCVLLRHQQRMNERTTSETSAFFHLLTKCVWKVILKIINSGSSSSPSCSFHVSVWSSIRRKKKQHQ